VVAEGVETAFQRDWLQNLGCQFGQGFYFGRGVAKAEIPKALCRSVLVV
jgi:EAL domain-containing protein (putative c-di-GMP-specific phosphodiesterase class I)